MQIWVIYGILLVTECCGTLGTAVNEAYFALFSMGAHGTGMTPYVRAYVSLKKKKKKKKKKIIFHGKPNIGIW